MAPCEGGRAPGGTSTKGVHMNGVTIARVAAVAVVAAASFAGTVPAQSADGPHWKVHQVLSGLNAPRGIATTPDGGVYVAESGATGAGDVGLTQGSVSKYVLRDGQLRQRWSTPFTGVYASEGAGSPDALGPAGLSSFCSRHDARRVCRVFMIDSVNHDEVVAGGGPSVPDIGHLFRLNSRIGASHDIADVGDANYAWTADHASLWEEFPDANPYGVLVTRIHGEKRMFVADAGANTISKVFADGSSKVISYIPNETPPGTRDATPTCVAKGPDGMLYVGTLDLALNFTQGGGQSNVWRVDPSSTDWAHNATLWATGLTTVTACMFDSTGNFWATEMFEDNGSAAPGDIVRLPFRDPTDIHHIGGGQLLLPGGIARGANGSLYVTVGSAAPNGAGGVVRLTREG
jgi:hypothetical protein